MTKVFIDGSAGTTGLRIYERLSCRNDIELIKISEEYRKDTKVRREALNEADLAFLCLPDAAAIETEKLLENENTIIIDTSTAHRTNDKWTYGFPEIADFREKIKSSKRIANPGCHASGFISLIAPLRENDLIKADASLTCFSITGYSGGGKKMIAEYEDPKRDKVYKAPRQYALGQSHKHLPEMTKICNLEKAPVFCPVVADFYSGMEVTVSLFAKDIKGNIEDIKEIYKDYYKSGIVSYIEGGDESGFMSAGKLAGYDDMQISVSGNDERIILISRFDNLGKGASGSAIQNMNICLSLPENTGLKLYGGIR